MAHIPGIRRLFRTQRTRAGVERAVDDELQFHFDMTMRDLMSGGMSFGLYSVIAYKVTQRTHEMGARVALGAQSRDVIRLIIREGLQVVVPGVAGGAMVASGAGRWIASLLFHESPKDPSVFVSVIVALLVVALTASWVPAMRASRVDPNEALRAD